MVEMLDTQINGKWTIKLPRHRHERPEWDLKNGGWEKERIQSICDNVKLGDIFYYIGNEEGDFSSLISTWGPQMVLIEPNEKVWPNTKAIYQANGLMPPFVSFVGFATDVNDYKEQYIIRNDYPKCADGEIISDHGFKQVQDGEPLPKIMIDTLVLVTGLIPKHISIDVEGHESFVLEGAKETLKKHRPNIWLSGHPDFMMLYYNQYLGDLRRWIRDIGYEEKLLAYDHEVHLFYTRKD